MIAAVDHFLDAKSSTPEEEIDRYLYLDEYLENYGFNGDYMLVLKWYNDYQAHGVYPFGRGAWEDQPQWVLDDFNTVGLKQEHAELKRKITERQKGG